MSQSLSTRRVAARSSALRARPHQVRWSAAVASGLAAGTALLALLVALGVFLYDESPWKIPRMVAATLRGEAALQPEGAFDPVLVALGLVLHYALSVLYALALAGVVADFRRWFVPWAGLAFGIALYFVNFHGFTALFSWFTEMRTVDTLLAHALFGVLLARIYCALAARAGKR